MGKEEEAHMHAWPPWAILKFGWPTKTRRGRWTWGSSSTNNTCNKTRIGRCRYIHFEPTTFTTIQEQEEGNEKEVQLEPIVVISVKKQ
jgi:hypothetical protein